MNSTIALMHWLSYKFRKIFVLTKGKWVTFEDSKPLQATAKRLSQVVNFVLLSPLIEVFFRKEEEVYFHLQHKNGIQPCRRDLPSRFFDPWNSLAFWCNQCSILFPCFTPDLTSDIFNFIFFPDWISKGTLFMLVSKRRRSAAIMKTWNMLKMDVVCIIVVHPAYGVCWWRPASSHPAVGEGVGGTLRLLSIE